MLTFAAEPGADRPVILWIFGSLDASPEPDLLRVALATGVRRKQNVEKFPDPGQSNQSVEWRQGVIQIRSAIIGDCVIMLLGLQTANEDHIQETIILNPTPRLNYPVSNA